MSSTTAQPPERDFFLVGQETDNGLPVIVDAGSGIVRGLPATSQPVLGSRRVKALLTTNAIVASARLESDRGTLFCFVPVFLGAGAFAYFLMPSEPVWWHVPTALAGSFACLAVCWRSYPARLMLFAAMLAITGIGLAQFEMWRAGTKMLGGEISTRLTGRVTATDYLASGRVRLTLDVISTERPRLRYAPDRVRVSARMLPAGIRAGDVVTGVVRLMPMLGPTRPGSYDFSFESYFDGIGATGFFLKNPELAAEPTEPPWNLRIVTYLENLRDSLADRVRLQVGGPEGEIAAALIMGVRAGIPEDVNEALRRTGLAHILSISGLHMALVAATVIWTLRFVFALIPGFAVRHPVRKYAAGAALLVLLIYLCISGNQVAAQRSFLMIAIMLAAMMFNHAALTMRNLALSAIVILLMSPHEVVGPSFQMSYAATAALIGAYGMWTRRPRRPAAGDGVGILWRLGTKISLYVGGAASTSLLAGTATAVFGIYHFQRVAPLSVFANLAAMPAVSVLVMPPALFAVILMPFGLDWIPLAVMGEGLRIMVGVAEWFSQRSPLDAVGTVDAVGVALISVALVLACLLTTSLRWSAAPFALAGLAICITSQRPVMFIAEDAALVAIATPDGKLAVTRIRPNAFTLQNWLYASGIADVRKPIMLDGEQAQDRSGSSPNVFRCNGSNCKGQFDLGEVVVTSDAAEASRHCGTAKVIIIADATANEVCPNGPASAITRRDLARLGTAAMIGGNIVYAIREPYRPWHANRQYSREARGLAPWKPRPRPDGRIQTKPEDGTSGR